MTSKNKKRRLHLDFGYHFCKIKAHTAILQRYSHIFPKYPQIFPGLYKVFFPGFSPNQMFWGCACTPCTPASYTSGWRCKANGRTQNRKCPMLRQQLHTVFSL